MAEQQPLSAVNEEIVAPFRYSQEPRFYILDKTLDSDVLGLIYLFQEEIRELESYLKFEPGSTDGYYVADILFDQTKAARKRKANTNL